MIFETLDYCLEKALMLRFLQLFVIALMLAAGPSRAQDYPNKPIVLVVPFARGGSSDFLSRLIGAKLTEARREMVNTSLQWVVIR